MPLFYYPNRPTLAPPDPGNPLEPRSTYIDELQASGKYVGTYKWNGDNTTVYTDDLSFWNREGKRLSYTPHPDMLKELKQFPKGCILNGELLHRHTKKVKDLLILHCVMGWKDQILRGKTWSDSRRLLEDQAWLPRTVGTQLQYGCHLLLEEISPSGFWRMFQEACEQDDAIEGIILKNPNGSLKFSVSKIEDVHWMLKIRKRSNKYSF